MIVTLDISDRLGEWLSALAAERALSIDELGQQALAIGLTRIAAEAPAGHVEIELGVTRLAPGIQLSMRAPIGITSPIRLRPITDEPDPASADS